MAPAGQHPHTDRRPRADLRGVLRLPLLGYANRIFVEPAPLLEHVAATNPDRIDELRRLILVDTPAFRS